MEKEVLSEIGNKNSKITMYQDGSMKVEGARYSINEEPQLDRLEKKVDRILHILESGELSTSFEREFQYSIKTINKEFDRRVHISKARNLSKGVNSQSGYEITKFNETNQFSRS